MIDSRKISLVGTLFALETSIRYLPNLVLAILLNISVRLFIHQTSIVYLVVMSSLICAISPLLMAIIDPSWSFW